MVNSSNVEKRQSNGFMVLSEEEGTKASASRERTGKTPPYIGKFDASIALRVLDQSPPISVGINFHPK